MGKLEPENPIFVGKNHGFRLRCSQENQSVELLTNEINYWYKLIIGITQS